jgi:hypothetical protein
VLLVVGAAALGVLFTWHATQKGPSAMAAPAAQSPACASRLLRDWADGRIDGAYPVACYRAALRSLPTDLEVYSSAHDDIAQALSKRIFQSRHGQKISGHQGAASTRKIASAP